MRIGIDARFLTHPQRGGFKTYTENLVMSLSEVDDVNEYVVYLDRPSPEANLPQKGNWHYKVIRGDFPMVGMPLREQILIKREIIRDQLDVVHFLCNTAPVNMRQPYVVTLHDTIQVAASKQSKKRMLGTIRIKLLVALAYSRWAINQSVRSASSIITVSNYEKEQISFHFNIPRERIIAIHLAPNPAFKPATFTQKNTWKLKLRERYGIQRKFIFGVGYEPRKNIDFLIRIFSHLASEYDNLDLVIVCAEENKRSYFKKLAEEFGLADRIFILGSLPAHELHVFYNLTEAFIYPSERESFGLPPLEAISCGAPTIAMNTTSVPEVLEKGAVLLDGKDAQEWVNTIRRIISDEEFRSELIVRGLEQTSKFSWRRCATETVQVYRNIAQV